MNANELFNRIIATGADENGIRDRFCGNVELYEICFNEFMEEPNFAMLRDDVLTQSYEKAFRAAHALKGISGNLGLTGFYDAIRTLTESLRNNYYDNVEAEYAEVERQHEILKRAVSEEQTVDVETDAESPAQTSKSYAVLSELRSLMKDKNGRITAFMLCLSVVAIVAIGVLFFKINTTHKKNVMEESSQHLTEISNQIKLYIEDNIATDWKIAQSVGDSILDSAYENDDQAVFNMLQRKMSVWGVSDLMLYTENGYCVCADGSTVATDTATKNVYKARELGKSLSIIDSKLIFTVPLDAELTFNGSKVVAISAVRDMSSFLDNMEFSSFGGTAWMYLTDESGVVVSTLTGPSTVQAYNVQNAIRGMDIIPLDKADAPEDFLTNQNTSVFLLSDGSNEFYGVSAPIVTGEAPMNLFYFVPENVVNNVMSGFSTQLTVLSMIIISLFAAGTFAASLLVHKSRKKMFDQAIMTRERMFDLLVKNTKTAFGLFTTGRKTPEFLSANAFEVIGDSCWYLEKTDEGFQVQNEENIETENIALVNEALREWDGRHTFRSGYLRNTHSATPTYFVFELYTVGKDKNSFVAIAQDVTSTFAREEAVKNAMESAKEANEAKTRFLSSMSHDIRTPMNAIMNMSNFALESIDQPKKLGSYLRVIHESAEHLLHLINDVLDVSRIESGQIVVASAPFNITEVIQRQIEIIRPMCAAKSQTLITDFSGLRETVVSGDALKLSQIIINLLSNAMKFTPERGAVRFTAVELPSLRKEIVPVRFVVEDNGLGISAEDIKEIFEPFNRAHDEAVSKTEGTGLGLTIVKNYVDVMGGSISCESEPGEGSTFTVELFFQKPDTPFVDDNPNAALTEATFLGMHALVAEDNHTNQLIAKEILERMGFILDFVEDGEAAVRKFCTSSPNTYDVIYMDIQMPVMDGYGAARHIRESGHPQAKTVPIIAMTANAFAEDIEKARVVGMNGYVDKPIVSFKLAEETKKAIREMRGET